MSSHPGTPRRRFAAFALATVTLSACSVRPPATPDAGSARACATRADCEAGQICAPDGRCDGCESSGQCRLKEVCEPEGQLCTLRAGWGERCARNDDCQAGSWCKQGLCADRASVSLCPAGANAECPQGERCESHNLVCEEDLGCSDDGDCGALEVCNSGSHACVPRCTADTQASVCVAGEKCARQMCVQCETAAECGAGLVCDAAGRCSSSQRCYQDRDCRIPLYCHLQTGACLARLPPCVSDESCGQGQRCEVGSGRCVPRACQPDAYEPNDDRASATGAAAGRYTGLTLCPGDADTFALSLARGDQLGVNIDADPFSESTFSLAIQDGTGRTLAYGKLLASYVAAVSGTHYVSLRTTDAYQPYDVTFLLARGTPCDDDAYESNDLASAATRASGPGLFDGTVCPQDQDYFSFAAPEGQSLRAALVNYDSAKGLLRLCLVRNGAELACSDGAAPDVTFGAAPPGGMTLLVRIAGSTDRVSNGYTLKLELQ